MASDEHVQDEKQGLTRRKFLIGGVAVAALIATPGVIVLVNSNGRARAFAVAYDEDISLWVGNGFEFEVIVRRGRTVIETHSGVTADTFDRLESEFFSVDVIDAPRAA